MITEIEISGYKGLRNIALTGLKRLTLIGGANNAGKTSILEAFFTAHDWGNPEILTRHLNWRGVDAIQVAAEAWVPAFSGFDISGKIQLKMKNSAGGREAFSAHVVDDGRSGTLSANDNAQNIRAPGEPTLRVSFTRGSKPVFEAVVQINKLLPPFTFRSSIARDVAPKLFYVVARQRSNPLEDAQAYGLLDQQKQTESVIRGLRAIEPRLVGLSVIPVGPQVMLFADVEGLPRKVPVNLLGDGVTRLLTLLLQIAKLQGGYLLIDEIENGFHYSTLPAVWRALYSEAKASKCQIIATTHSYECLTAYAGALSDLAPDDYSYVRLDKEVAQTSEGNIQETIFATQYDAVALRNAIEGQWEVR